VLVETPAHVPAKFNPYSTGMNRLSQEIEEEVVMRFSSGQKRPYLFLELVVSK